MDQSLPTTRDGRRAAGHPAVIDTAGVTRSFDALVAEALAAPIEGWNFDWLDGRATEERPPWRYSRRATRAIAEADRVLDVQTGGGELLAEMLADAPTDPAMVAATESWAPNAARACRTLAPFGVRVSVVEDASALPFDDATFDLVLSRHPVVTRWDEVSRVLRPGGRYVAQHVGAGSNRELTDFLMGEQPVASLRSPERAEVDARRAGLDVRDLRRATLVVEFFDIGSVVYFLRLVPWTVPGFVVDRYRDRLSDLHRSIETEGAFRCHAQRFFIEAVRPG